MSTVLPNPFKSRTYNIIDWGAIGDGMTDDTQAVQQTLDQAVRNRGSMYVPAGTYRISVAIWLKACLSSVAVWGEASNLSVFVSTNGNHLFNFSFQQQGICQPWGLHIRDVGFKAEGPAGTAIIVSYGNPAASSDHYQPSTVIRNVAISSGPEGWWTNGVNLEAAWNVTMTDVYIAGDPKGGDWNAMSGAGILASRMCVNCHFTNVHCNFWAAGFKYENGNTEGLMFTNCSFVANKRGVYIVGNGAEFPHRMSTLTWTGGLIECRVTGVVGGSAAFHLVNVWTALISSMQMVTEALPGFATYGLFLDNCNGVVVTGCDINAWTFGLYTVGNCKAILSHGNTYTNIVTAENQFNGGTSLSRSYGHTNTQRPVQDVDHGENNKLGFDLTEAQIADLLALVLAKLKT